MTPHRDVPFDVGLQPERTALAWRRTALALGVGPVVVARLLAPERGVLALVAVVVGLVLGLGVLAGAGLRHRRIHARLTGAGPTGAGRGDPGAPTDTQPPRLPGAGLLAVTAGIPVAAGSIVLLVVVSRLL